MDNSFSLYQNAAILAPSSRQEDFLILKRQKPELSFQLYSLEDVETMFALQSDNRALIRVYLDHAHDYEKAKDELRVLSYLKPEKAYPTAKIEELKPLQQALMKEGLLYPLVCPERSFENHPVIISGYHCGSHISEILGELHNMAISYDFEKISANPLRIAQEFSDIYGELAYLFNRMATDLASGTPIDDLYLLGADESYEDLLQRFAKIYGIPVESAQKRSLYDSSLYRTFRPLFLQKGVAALDDLSALYPTSPDTDTIYRLIKRFAERIPPTEANLAHFYDGLMKDMPQSQPHYAHLVHRLTSYIPPKNAHVYLINFQMGLFPPVAAEDDYLSERELSSLGLMNAKETTEEWGAELQSLLKSDALALVSYKRKAFGSQFFPSGLLSMLGFQVEKDPVLPYDYSHDKAAFLQASLRDLKENYLYEDPRLSALQEEVPLPDYRGYRYAFTNFPFPFANEKRSYSPTQLKAYYGCPFSYYCARILSVQENELNFSSRIGTLFHSLMQAMVAPGFDFDSRWGEAYQNEVSKNGPFSPKEEALLPRLKEECQKAVAFYQAHESLLINPVFHAEEAFSLVSKENPLVSFAGQFDSIVEFGQANRYYVIIDYKTSGERFDEKLLPFGLSMQLPYYAYYATQDQALQNAELIGLFIGPILSPTLVKPVKETLEKFSADNFKLEGVFAKDIDKLLAFDPSARMSDFIRSLAYSSKGFYAYSLARAKTPDDFKSLAGQAEKLTLEADQRIRAGDFAISPAQFKNSFDACQYCSFRDICYRPEDAIRHLDGLLKADDDDDEEEEGEDENGME
jgi:hypothetical protein